MSRWQGLEGGMGCHLRGRPEGVTVCLLECAPVSGRVCLRYLYPAQHVPVCAFEPEGTGNARPAGVCRRCSAFLCLSLYAYEQGLYATSVMSGIETLSLDARHTRARFQGVDYRPKAIPCLKSSLGSATGEKMLCVGG